MLPCSRRLVNALVPVFALAMAASLAAGAAESKSNLRATGDPTPLDAYVAAPDAHYGWELSGTFEAKEYTSHVIRMTSQAWRSPEEVDHPVWKHWLVIVVPKKVATKTALMVIAGGSNGMDQPKGADPNLRRAALAAGAVCAQISNIPNEPLVFSDDGRRRTEDGIIAHNWDKFLRTGDATWLTRLPMTKAVVRAMDTVQEFCASKAGGRHKVETFVTAGASKRGWTTWTTAAVDRRVIGAVPIVIDLLNIVPSFKHHYSVYGGWAPAINDYVEMGIMDWIGSPEFDALAKIVEPYSYRDRLTMPKLIMNGAGDQFFVNDSWRFYLHDLKGTTRLRYAPNAGHGMDKSDAIGSVVAFFKSIVDNKPLPEYSWTFPDENSVRVTAATSPLAVKLWQATNPEARDFRLDVFGPNWKETPLEADADGAWTGRVEKPEKGWTAFLVELHFPGPGKDNHVFTTPVRITPDVLPHAFVQKTDWPDGFLHKQREK